MVKIDASIFIEPGAKYDVFEDSQGFVLRIADERFGADAMLFFDSLKELDNLRFILDCYIEEKLREREERLKELEKEEEDLIEVSQSSPAN